MPIVNDNECVRKINSVTEKIFILPASSFCAGGEKGHDACQVKTVFSFCILHDITLFVTLSRAFQILNVFFAIQAFNSLTGMWDASNHRIRMEREAKAKVVTSVLGAEFVQFLFIQLFQIDRGKRASIARI